MFKYLLRSFFMDKNKLLNSVGKIGVKPFIIFILVLLFLIPLHMLDSLVDDRKSYQRDAVQMWTMMYWKAQHERSVITSGGMGTMGFGTGAALGAKLADKNNPVLLITGELAIFALPALA